MRRPLVLFSLSFVLSFLLVLSACGGSDDAQPDPAATAQQQQQAETQEPQAAQQASQQTEQTEQSSGQPGPLKIAFIGDLTGGLAEIGVEMRDGFLLAIKHINAAGGVFGQPVEFVLGDTNTDPTIAIEEARRVQLKLRART